MVSKLQFFSCQRSQRLSSSPKPSGAQTTSAEFPHDGRSARGRPFFLSIKQAKYLGEMPCQSISRVVGSRQKPTKACWLNQKIVRKRLPSSSRALAVGSSGGT